MAIISMWCSHLRTFQQTFEGHDVCPWLCTRRSLGVYFAGGHPAFQFRKNCNSFSSPIYWNDYQDLLRFFLQMDWNCETTRKMLPPNWLAFQTIFEAHDARGDARQIARRCRKLVGSPVAPISSGVAGTVNESFRWMRISTFITFALQPVRP